MDDLKMTLDQMAHEHHLLFLDTHRHLLPKKEEEDGPRFVNGDKVCWESFGAKKWRFGVVLREKSLEGVVVVWEVESSRKSRERQEPTRTKGLVTVMMVNEPDFDCYIDNSEEIPRERLKLYDPEVDYY